MGSKTASADTSPTRHDVTRDDQPDEEGRERPVREKLEETTIEEQRKRNSEELADTDMKEVSGSIDGRGRVRKKRSFEDTEDIESENASKHTRKRSRDTDEKPRPAKKEKADLEDGGSEKSGNVSSEPANVDDALPTGEAEQPTPETSTAEAPKSNDEASNGTQQHSTSAQFTSDEVPASPSKIAPSSGFANASSKSPFASLEANKSPFSTSSATSGGTGFASSGFASFSKPSASPFGTLSPTKENKTSATQPTPAASPEKPKEKLSFVSAGTASSGFGSLVGPSSGFGGALSSSSPFKSATGGSTLKSFASSSNSTAPNGLASKSVKPFGAGADDDEDDDDTAEGYDPEAAQPVGTQTEEKQDERFYEQNMETGEEGELTFFQCRAKLYWMHENAWKERGVGVFKVNVARVDPAQRQIPTEAHKEAELAPQAKDNERDEKNTDANDTTKEETEETNPKESFNPSSPTSTARFIFRTDGSHRMMLNSPITDQVELKDRAGGAPRSKSTIFTGFVDGKPTPCLIQV